MRKPKVGWYEAINPATGEVLSQKLMRAKEVQRYSKDFWLMMFEKTDSQSHTSKTHFTIGASGAIMREDTDITDVIDDVIDDHDEASIRRVKN